MANFEHLKPGDRVTRLLAGTKPMLMEVISVKGDLLTCGAVLPDGQVFRGDWTFDRNSGVEEDHELQWGIKFGRTGSVLTEEKK